MSVDASRSGLFRKTNFCHLCNVVIAIDNRPQIRSYFHVIFISSSDKSALVFIDATASAADDLLTRRVRKTYASNLFRTTFRSTFMYITDPTMFPKLAYDLQILLLMSSRNKVSTYLLILLGKHMLGEYSI